MRFSSATKYVEPLSDFVGTAAAQEHISDWLTNQIDLVDNLEFGQRFAAHFDKYTAEPIEYSHRLLDLGGSKALAGIRFYRGDSKRPFVDLLAWQGDLSAKLLDSVREEWATFAPFAVRFVRPSKSNAVPPKPVYLDQSIHVERCDRITDAPDASVRLEPVEDLDDALDRVRTKYSEIASDPALAAEVSAVSREELEDCRRTGTVDWITYNQTRVGVLATYPETIAFIHGHVIVEEVVFQPHNGKGLATAAQQALAKKLPPNSSIIGTIQRLNHASRISAKRAGRMSLFEYVFIDLSTSD